MSKRKVVHVVPTSGGNWAVKREHADRASGIHDRKDEAIEQGRKLAKGAPLGQLMIHKKDGTIQTEYTYRKDPEKYPG